MCIGLPMRLLSGTGSHGLVQGRGRRETVDLRLVGAVEPGQWLLVFHGAAREALEPERAAEIDAARDRLEAGLAGTATPDDDPGFELPSAMSAERLAALTGGTR
jgi:hydrogenase expression/formation protein HypC